MSYVALRNVKQHGNALSSERAEGCLGARALRHGHGYGHFGTGTGTSGFRDPEVLERG